MVDGYVREDEIRAHYEAENAKLRSDLRSEKVSNRELRDDLAKLRQAGDALDTAAGRFVFSPSKENSGRLFEARATYRRTAQEIGGDDVTSG